MKNWIKEGLDFEINTLQINLGIISGKEKTEEWKRDHYRYTFAVTAQRIFNLLNTSITVYPAAGAADSTKTELRILRAIIDEMLV